MRNEQSQKINTTHTASTIYEISTDINCCPFCKKAFHRVAAKVQVDNSSTIFKEEAEIKLIYCSKCRRYYLYDREMDKLKKRKPKLLFRKIRYEKPISEEIKPEPSVVEQIPESEIKYVIVYKRDCTCLSCERAGHYPNMENYSLCVNNLNDEEVLIPVYRCDICGRFYVSEIILKQYEKRYGKLLFQRISERTLFGSYYEDYDYDEYRYEDDTILSRCGYSAQINDPCERWAILEYIMLSGKATKAEISDLLNYFIADRGKRCYKACPNWERDLKYISDYNIETHHRVYKFVFKRSVR